MYVPMHGFVYVCTVPMKNITPQELELQEAMSLLTRT